MLKDFLLFRRMLMPILLQILFWLAVVVSLVTALVDFFHGEWLIGIQILILGPILSRVFCEFLILFFRMNESLTDIRNMMRKDQQQKFNPNPEIS